MFVTDLRTAQYTTFLAVNEKVNPLVRTNASVLSNLEGMFKNLTPCNVDFSQRSIQRWNMTTKKPSRLKMKSLKYISKKHKHLTEHLKRSPSINLTLYSRNTDFLSDETRATHSIGHAKAERNQWIDWSRGLTSPYVTWARGNITKMAGSAKALHSCISLY